MTILSCCAGDAYDPPMKILLNIDVDDIEAAIAFYTKAFELRLARRMGDDFVELLGGSCDLYLLRKAEGSTPCPGSARSYARHWTPVHVDFLVDDVDAAVARALSAGATQEGGIEEHAYGRLALFADPFGHGFCLLQLVGAGYDAITTSPPPRTKNP